VQRPPLSPCPRQGLVSGAQGGKKKHGDEKKQQRNTPSAIHDNTPGFEVLYALLSNNLNIMKEFVVIRRPKAPLKCTKTMKFGTEVPV
jgi:hypothetical protein